MVSFLKWCHVWLKYTIVTIHQPSLLFKVIAFEWEAFQPTVFKLIACIQLFNWHYLVPIMFYAFIMYRICYPEATSGFLYNLFQILIFFIFATEVTLVIGYFLNEVKYIENLNFWSSFRNIYVEYFGNTEFGRHVYPNEAWTAYYEARSSETSYYDNENKVHARWLWSSRFSANPLYYVHHGLIDNPASAGYSGITLILSIAAVLVVGSIRYHFFLV